MSIEVQKAEKDLKEVKGRLIKKRAELEKAEDELALLVNSLYNGENFDDDNTSDDEQDFDNGEDLAVGSAVAVVRQLKKE